MLKRIILIVFISIYLIFCCSIDNNNSNSNNNNSDKKSSNEELVLQNADKTIELQNQYYNDILSVLNKYLTTTEIEQIKNLKESIDLIDIDLIFTILENQYKNLSDDNKKKLKLELEILNNNFLNIKPKAIKNVFNQADMPPGFSENDEYIILGDDAMIDKADPENAIMISNFIKTSKGIQIDLNEVSNTKGLTASNIGKWSKGIVPYLFSSNLNNEERDVIRNCMHDWETASKNKVKFKELNITDGSDFFILLLVIQTGYPYITISKKDLDIYTAGRATLGRCHNGFIYLDPLYTKDVSTIRHELGHTLGLYHEHQRPDRDKYIKISKQYLSNNNYKKVKDEYIKILWFKIRTVKTSYSSIYDYQSIMHYPNYKDPEYGWRFTDLNGQFISTRSSNITDTDASFIKSVY